MPTVHSDYQSLPRKSGGTFQQLTEIKEKLPMKQFWSALNSDLSSFLWHHFGDKWLTAQEHHLDPNLHVGDLMVNIHFAERQGLTRKRASAKRSAPSANSSSWC